MVRVRVGVCGLKIKTKSICCLCLVLAGLRFRLRLRLGHLFRYTSAFFCLFNCSVTACTAGTKEQLNKQKKV